MEDDEIMTRLGSLGVFLLGAKSNYHAADIDHHIDTLKAAISRIDSAKAHGITIGE